MGIFDKLKKRESEPVQSNNQWNNLSDVKFNDANIYNAQYNKTISALIPGSGNVNYNAISSTPNATKHDEDILLAKIATGEVGNNDYRNLMRSIKGPLMDRDGNFQDSLAFAQLGEIAKNAQELKMLAYASGAGVNNYGSLNVNDVRSTIQSFDNPMDFENAMQSFMVNIARNNPPQKVAEYNSSLKNLEKSLYGKRFEYWNQINDLRKKSRDMFGDPLPERTEYVQPQQNYVERERTREQLISGGSVYQISRAQARNGIRARMGESLQVDNNCEDSKYIDTDRNVFAVFDGAGGHEGGRRASSIASETMKNILENGFNPKTPKDLSDMLDEASRRISRDSAAGFSTGTLAKILKTEDGKKGIIFAQVGDSRLYIVRANGATELATKDEGYENVITNSLGTEKDKTCVQFGYRELAQGDRIVLCSDGITGDKGADLMSEQELGGIVRSCDNIAYAAQALVHSARKNDDRTAVVVGV